ncbi:MAG: AraC family transcriptional regulator [Bacteroidota bacterium]
MKPSLRQIISTPESSFLVRRDVGADMLNDWHYHPELELLYLKRSSGTWIVGDHIGPFQNGDLLLIGANLPHCFRHAYDISGKNGIAGESICIKFVPEIFGNRFLQLPELRGIKDLMQKANGGLKLTGRLQQRLPLLLEEMLAASAGKKLILLLNILQEISESKEYISLSSDGFIQRPTGGDTDKIRRVFEYTFNHFVESITIKDVASLLNMTSPSFCRYFKTKTQKTYIRFLMEVRIGYACRLLTEDEKNISGVSYSCGYNNISHFNHQFKGIMGVSPLTYKKDYFKKS